MQILFKRLSGWGIKKGCMGLMKVKEQAGAELCQAQVKIEVVVERGVEFGVEVKAYHF